MESIDLKVLQELFKNKSKYYISTNRGHEGIGTYGEVQGEYNSEFKYYRHPDMPDNLFLQEEWRTDSYGDNDNIYEYQFVTSVVKTVTVYEPIK